MKKIIIVGASSGLGYQIAADFARMGWRVGMTARREAPMKALKQQYPDNIDYALFDVSAPDAVTRFEDLIETIGGMDILLYTAGCGWENPMLDQALDSKTIAANVTGFTAITTAAYKYFKATANVTGGRIAAITSVAGVKGMGVSAVYSASKRYQWTFLQALDQLAHIQHVNVGITDIRPGFVDTPLLKEGRNYPMLMSTMYAARKIENAILKGRRIAYIDSRWAIATRLIKLIPDSLWRHLDVTF